MHKYRTRYCLNATAYGASQLTSPGQKQPQSRIHCTVVQQSNPPSQYWNWNSTLTWGLKRGCFWTTTDPLPTSNASLQVWIRLTTPCTKETIAQRIPWSLSILRSSVKYSMDLEETTSITKPQAYSAPTVSGGWMAVGTNSKRWQSGCTQGGTRLMDSQRTSTALSLARGLSHSDGVGPSVLCMHAMDLNKNTRSHQHNGDCVLGSRH